MRLFFLRKSIGGLALPSFFAGANRQEVAKILKTLYRQCCDHALAMARNSLCTLTFDGMFNQGYNTTNFWAVNAGCRHHLRAKDFSWKVQDAATLANEVAGLANSLGVEMIACVCTDRPRVMRAARRGFLKGPGGELLSPLYGYLGQSKA